MTNYWLPEPRHCYAASLSCYARILLRRPICGWAAWPRCCSLAGSCCTISRCSSARTGSHAVPYDDLYGSLSLFAWLLAAYLSGARNLSPAALGGRVRVPLAGRVDRAAWSSVAPLRLPSTPPPARGPLLALHVTLNTWAYAAFALSFVLSLIYLVQDRLLRSHDCRAAFWRFPAARRAGAMAAAALRWACGSCCSASQSA